MASPSAVLAPLVSHAIEAAFGPEFTDADPVLRDSRYADIQVNAAPALAKRLGANPRQVAERILQHLDLSGICSAVEVSGPGFINLTMADDWIAAEATLLTEDSRFGVPTQSRQVVVIDYSAPNVAKEMHVGHLRTTVVGDALARTLEYLGHHVVRQNHIGDWGTPFGMLIEYLLEVGVGTDTAEAVRLDPNTFYQAARAKFDGDADFARRARGQVVRLQAGEPETLGIWNQLVELSKSYFNRIYSMLGVTLTDADLAGESTYNDALADVCDELQDEGLASVSDGALCVFLDGYTGRDGKPVPLIVRKADGGFGYATTDLATLRYRVGVLGADRMLYVVGATQELHLSMVFETARLARWLPESVSVTHVKIGNVLGADRKILKTRSGAPLRLMALLDEAVSAARMAIDESRPDLDADVRATVAPLVGIGAVKYADLSVAHDSEYIFDLNRMVQLTGNTGPYLQYATARIRSIFRAGLVSPEMFADTPFTVGNQQERTLAILLLEFGDVVVAVGEHLEPHRLCGYLFEVAQAFSGFYETVPVLKAEPVTRESRLALCAVTLGVLVQGLELLGIVAPDVM